MELTFYAYSLANKIDAITWFFYEVNSYRKYIKMNGLFAVQATDKRGGHFSLLPTCIAHISNNNIIHSFHPSSPSREQMSPKIDRLPTEWIHTVAH